LAFHLNHDDAPGREEPVLKVRDTKTANQAGAQLPSETDVQAQAGLDDITAWRPRAIGSLVLVTTEMKRHVPFTMLGTLTGIVIMLAFVVLAVPRTVSVTLFWSLHPLHVLLSALVTTAMFTLHSRRNMWWTMFVGYVGSVGIATLSDCVIPYLAESLLDLPNRGLHLGFIEKWWLVNPLAAAGIFLGYYWPRTRLTHAAHVLLSTWASLFHMTMAMGDSFGAVAYAALTVFLFLAVWVPCCTSDIVFPLLFVEKPISKRAGDRRPDGS
jgi:hypothetical protein